MAAYLENVEFLVVDDNAGMRMVIKNVLHALQVKRIKEADNGETAFDIVRTTPPDIILSDWEMAPMDGLEFTRMIRNSEQSPNPFLPVIMVSGYAQRGRVLAARDAGVTEFVVKPISAKTLFSRVRAVIESPRPFVRTKTFFGPDRRRSKIDYDGPERRGEEAKTVAPPPPDQVISQDEINVLFNPDTEGDNGEDAVYVSRIRKDPTNANALNMWVVSDNLRKGAALNTVQIGEELIRSHMQKAA